MSIVKVNESFLRHSMKTVSVLSFVKMRSNGFSTLEKNIRTQRGCVLRYFNANIADYTQSFMTINRIHCVSTTITCSRNITKFLGETHKASISKNF